MKFDLVSKQFKLKILIVFFNEIFQKKGNNCCCTDCFKVNFFNVGMHLDMFESIWFKLGMMIDFIALYILILV